MTTTEQEPKAQPVAPPAPVTDGYIQFAAPDVPYSAIHIPLSYGERGIERAMQLAKYLSDAYGKAFPDAPREATQAPSAPAQSASAPKCRLHNRPMKASKRGGWMCTFKLADETYCTETAA